MALELSFENGSLAGTQVVTASAAVRIGRDPETCDIVLESDAVSRRHAVFRRHPTGYTVELWGRLTQVNGERVEVPAKQCILRPVHAGDRFDLGGTRFSVTFVDVRLTVTAGRAAGTSLALDDTIHIGATTGDLALGEPALARDRLVIATTPRGFVARAPDGVRFNGRPGTRRLLSHGDEIAVGNTRLRFSTSSDAERGSSDLESFDHTRTLILCDATNVVGELVCLAGSLKGERIPIGDQNITIGTRSDVEVVLADPLASPHHCTITRAGASFVVTDHGSASGVWIDGARIDGRAPLVAGDLLTIGRHTFQAVLVGGLDDKTLRETRFAAERSDHALPRFVFDGRVVSAPRIIAGSAQDCEIRIAPAQATESVRKHVQARDLRVARRHFVLEWQDGFELVDLSSWGTHVDNTIVIRKKLSTSFVVALGTSLVHGTICGDVCCLEVGDAILRSVAIERARNPTNALDTIFSIDDAAAEAAMEKQKIQREAPVWRDSSDLRRDRTTRVTIALAAAVAILLCIGFARVGEGQALMGHPLSPAHSTQTFVEKLDGTTICTSCHASGARIDRAGCIGCHPTLEQRHAIWQPRAKHAAKPCESCHREHVERPDPKGGLFASATCQNCHPRQHDLVFAQSKNPDIPVPQRVRAPRLTPRPAMVDLHVSHAFRDIGCNGCHTRILGTTRFEAGPGLTCFRCHERVSDDACDVCHVKEHATSVIARTGDLDDMVLAPPTGKHSIPWALGSIAIGVAPAIAYIFVRRRARKAREADELRKLVETPSHLKKAMLHSVNEAKCVGCNECVKACPTQVLDLGRNHKARVVNFDACISCMRCEKACAFDALRMYEIGKQPPKVSIPELDPHYEVLATPGMFVVGQVAGTSQIKNALNLGRAAVERIVQQGGRPGLGAASGNQHDVIIVGSGPAGLSAAVTCVEHGLSYVVLEKAAAYAWTVRNYYFKGKEVMAEPYDVDLLSAIPHADTTREQLLAQWDALVQRMRLSITCNAPVTDIRKSARGFEVDIGGPPGTATRTVTAARVVVAIGSLGVPRPVGCPGDHLDKVRNSLVDPDECQGRSIVVIGGSDSAVEVVLVLSGEHRKNTVHHIVRGEALGEVKPRNREQYEAALKAKRFSVRYASAVTEVTATTVKVRSKTDGSEVALPNDVVFAMTGGESIKPWLQKIGIKYTAKEHSWVPPRTDHVVREATRRA